MILSDATGEPDGVSTDRKADARASGQKWDGVSGTVALAVADGIERRRQISTLTCSGFRQQWFVASMGSTRL